MDCFKPIVSACAWFLVSQIAAPSPVAAQGLLGDLLDERVVQIDLWAADKKGNPLSGLTADDLTLLEDGEPVSISKVEPGSPTLRLVVYVDNIHVQKEGRDRALSDLAKAIDQGLGTGTQVMLATYDGSLAIRQPFTSDRSALAASLEELVSIPPEGDQWAAERRDLLERLTAKKTDCTAALPDIKSYSQKVHERVAASLDHLETLVRSLSHFDDRKAVLLVSDGLELFAAQDVYEQLADACGGNRKEMGDLAQEFDISKGLIHLAAVANTSDTTIVAIEAFGPLGSGAGPVKAKQRPNADNQPTGMVMKSADGVPMVPIAGLGESGAGDPTPEQIRARSLRSSLAFLASRTGGVTVFDTKNFKSHFETLPALLQPYYTVTFTPDRQADGQIHTLALETKKKGIETRFNQSHLDQKPAREYGDRLMAFLLYGSNEPNRLGIGVSVEDAATADASGSLARVTVPLASVVLRPYQGELVGRLSFLTVVQDSNGKTTSLQQTTTDIAPLPGEAEYVESIPIALLDGDQVLAVAVVDVGGDSASFVKHQLTISP